MSHMNTNAKILNKIVGNRTQQWGGEKKRPGGIYTGSIIHQLNIKKENQNKQNYKKEHS